MNKILIKNCNIVSMTDESDVFLGDIAIENDLITEVSENIDVDTLKPDKIIDAGNMVAMPGFVNCHTHSAMTLFRGYADDLPLMEWLEKKIWPLEKKLTDKDIYWGTMLAVLEMIKSGTTTFSDMYFCMDEVASAAKETGIRANLSVGLIGLFGDKDLDEGIEFAEKWNNTANGRITTTLGPHAPYTCPPEFLKKVLKKAESGDLGIHIHVAETQQEVKEISERYNKTPVQYLYDLGVFEFPTTAAHCVHINDKDIELLLKNKVGITHCPESNMKLASGIAPIPKLLEAEALIGLGTDGAASNNNLDMIEEMRSAALLHKVNNFDPTVVNSFESFEMANKSGAKILGLGDKIGQIKEGMKADIILMDFEKPHFKPLNNIYAHLVYSAISSDVDTVIIDGQILMENRNVLGIDEEKIYYEVKNSVERITTK